jgi:hypothetical protein
MLLAGSSSRGVLKSLQGPFLSHRLLALHFSHNLLPDCTAMSMGVWGRASPMLVFFLCLLK